MSLNNNVCKTTYYILKQILKFIKLRYNVFLAGLKEISEKNSNVVPKTTRDVFGRKVVIAGSGADNTNDEEQSENTRNQYYHEELLKMLANAPEPKNSAK